MMRRPSGLRRGRSVRALLGSLVVCLGVSACGGIPAVGPVTEGPRLGERPVGGLIAPAGPEEGAGPEDIVRGFIQAGGGFGKEHQVARSYLVSSQRTSWRPDSRVTVYPGLDDLAFHAEPSPDDGEDTGPDGTDGKADRPGRTVVRVTAPVTAMVDEDGAMTNAGAGSTVTLTYVLDYAQGLGWRISQLDDGILLSEGDFRFTYSDVALYFPDRTGAYLVPDIRWFPEGSTATRAARQLLEGPSAWLDPAVVSGFPIGTEFAEKNVTIEDGEATVDVTEAALNATEEQRRLLVAQLAATLSGVSAAIERVRVTVKQADFASGGTRVESFRGPTLIRRTPSRGMTPVAVDRNGTLVSITATGAVPVKGVDALNAIHGNRPAAAPDESRYAVLSADRSRLYVAAPVRQVPGEDARGKQGAGIAGPGKDDPTKVRLALRGSSLVAPSFDPQGWVWSASQQGSGLLVAASGDGRAAAPAAGWLAGSTVVALRLSRDGSRVAIVVHRAGRGSVVVAGVVRRPDGTPERLGDPYEVLPDLTDARAVSWSGEATLTVLGKRVGHPEQPWVITIGGQPEGTLAVAHGQSIAANRVLPGSPLNLYVGTAAGQVWKHAGGRWVSIAAARWPAMPG